MENQVILDIFFITNEFFCIDLKLYRKLRTNCQWLTFRKQILKTNV